MDFTLDEAIKKLQNAGLIVEDTETDDDAYWEEYNKQKLNKKTFDNSYRYDSYGYHKKSRSMDDKIVIGRLTNLIPLLRDAGIEVGELEADLAIGGRGGPVKLPIRANGKYKGVRPRYVQCQWSRRLNDYRYIICDVTDAIMEEFDTAEEAVEFLAGLN